MSGQELPPTRFCGEVAGALSGERVDKALSLIAGLSRREAAELVARGRVRIDGRLVEARSQRITAGQLLEAELCRDERPSPRGDPSVEFEVVHEDASLIVVDKPAGLVVHAGAGTTRPTLVDGLLARYPELSRLPAAGAGDPGRPGIMHRLDKGTSGLLVVARTVEAHRCLSLQFREHTARRSYIALVEGTVEAPAGIVDAPIARSQRRPDQMAVRAGGRPARTQYRVLGRYVRPRPYTLIQAELATGRTHQIRVHLSAIGHPVVGDDRYGGSTTSSATLGATLKRGRLFLHAHRLEVEHPGGVRMQWTSDLPEDLTGVLDAFGGR